MSILPALHDIERKGGKGGETAAEAGDAQGAQGGVVAGKCLREVADEQAADEVRQACAEREGAGGQGDAEQVARHAAQSAAEEDKGEVLQGHRGRGWVGCLFSPRSWASSQALR